MAKILDFLNKPQMTQKKTINPFEGWPYSAPVKEVPAGKLGNLPPLEGLEKGNEVDAKKYGGAIVIGLGLTGCETLYQWLAQFSVSINTRQDKIRVGLIAAEDKAYKQDWEKCVNYRHFPLVAVPSSYNSARITENQRSADHILFRQAVNRDMFYGWLQNCLMDLHGNIRVMIIGSLQERAIGLIGDVLQALHVVKNDHNPYLSITALLSLCSPKTDLDEGESYAALREIGRFTFGGLHEMEPALQTNKTFIGTALLDHVFLIEDRCQPPTVLDLSKTEFSRVTGQAMAEALFTLLHPSSIQLWNNLSTELKNSTDSRMKGRQAVFHTFGISTLFVPVKEIKTYAASRLAWDALYGQKARPGEGLISQGHRSANDLSANDKNLVSQWLKSPHCYHPVFEWFQEARSKTDFLLVPSLSPSDIPAAFQAQISYGLCEFLNQEKENNLLKRAEELLSHLELLISIRMEWIKELIPSLKKTYDHEDFLRIISSWLVTVISLRSQVSEWRKTLETGDSNEPGRAVEAASVVSKTTSWRKLAGIDQETPLTIANQQDTTSFYLLLRAQIENSEHALRDTARGIIRQSVIIDDHGNDSLVEVEHYYTDTIRPELSHHGMTDGQVFRQVRQRLGWWVDLRPDSLPHLMFVCLPSHLTGKGEMQPPPEKSCFSTDQVSQILENIMAAAYAQIEGLDSDLCGRWFLEQLEKTGKKLAIAQSPLLVYDQEITSQPPFSSYVSEDLYLIGSNKTTTGLFRGTAFPFANQLQVNELEYGERNRLNALRILSNIPSGAILKARAWYKDYGHRKNLHLYSQERNATIYERAIRGMIEEKGTRELPPPLCMVLANLELSTLFCQALFCKLINIVNVNEKLGQKKYWILQSLSSGKQPGESFDPLVLSSVDAPDGLFDSFYRFTLELPNEDQQQFNPTLPFFAANRSHFLELIKDRVKKIRSDPENFQNLKNDFHRSILDPLKTDENKDPLIKGLANLLEVELETPQWEGW